jgi:hypothetical protein
MRLPSSSATWTAVRPPGTQAPPRSARRPSVSSPSRGHAFYGDEDDLVPPSELFDRAEAEEAIAVVERLLAQYRLLVEIP